MRNCKRICSALTVFLGGMLLWGIGCTDLDQYQKPEGERRQMPQPETRSVELKLTPEELALTQSFAKTLLSGREQFSKHHDTTAFLGKLDSLATVAAENWRSLPDTSGARNFYIVANADVLNQIFILRRATGDEMGARRAQRLLMELKPHLPEGTAQ